jgi:predicted transposase YbfD/YdcC
MPLADLTVSSDAMSCQKKTVNYITSSGADYLINVKDNQPSLNGGVEIFFAQATILCPNDVNLAYYCFPCDKAHGLIERREIWVASLDDEMARQRILFADWSGLRSAAKATRRFQCGNCVNKPEEMRRNCMSSWFYDPKEMIDVIIKHWEVETLHNLLNGDPFQEDECRIRNKSAAPIWSTFRKVCLNMLWPTLKMHPGTSMPSLTRQIDRSKQYGVEALTKGPMKQHLLMTGETPLERLALFFSSLP